METKYVNEFGTEIPEHIAKKAREMGCDKPAYIYKEDEWEKHNKYPASNLDGKPHRFSSTNYINHKVSLGDGWVVFRSPSGSKKSSGW